MIYLKRVHDEASLLDSIDWYAIRETIITRTTWVDAMLRRGTNDFSVNAECESTVDNSLLLLGALPSELVN